MAIGRRRAEWSRTGELLAMIHNRTSFDEKEPAKQSWDFFPPGLITAADRARNAAVAGPKIMLTGRDLQALVRGNPTDGR